MNGSISTNTTLTKFRVQLPYHETLTKIQTVLIQQLSPNQVFLSEQGELTLTTLDNRKQLLSGAVNIQADEMYEDVTLVQLQRRRVSAYFSVSFDRTT